MDQQWLDVRQTAEILFDKGFLIVGDGIWSFHPPSWELSERPGILIEDKNILPELKEKFDKALLNGTKI